MPDVFTKVDLLTSLIPMPRQLERLLELDRLIRSSQRCTADSLATALERSERTIRNDIAFLRDRYEAPIVFSHKKGWHYTHKDWRLPTIPLAKGELFALTLGARMLEAYAGSAYRGELESAIAQLAKRLPENLAVDLHQLAEQNVLFRGGAALDLEPKIWHQLEQACAGKKQVWMRYGTPGKPISERKFDPYVLHFSRSNPYVTGWCHQRDMVRWFRVDRIQKLEIQDESFEIDPSFNREAHFAEAFQHEVGGEPRKIAIWFDAQTAPYIRERRWHPSQEIEENADGSLVLRFVVRGLAEVKRWILFYGAGAKALEPPDLVTLVQKDLQEMQKLYTN